jgi:tetratricopeptide (TPR) repeat protein
MKTFANTLYADGQYEEAMEKYAEAITAADFGDVKESKSEHNNRGNVETLVIPVLTNLAACCIHLKQWNKAIQFCTQAIELNPDCAKAYLRLGLAQLNLGEFSNSKISLKKALEVANESNDRLEQSMTTINDSDKQRIKILLAKADEGLKYDKKAETQMYSSYSYSKTIITLILS